MGVAIILAFIYGWQLTLLVLAFLPLIAIAGAINWAVMSGNTVSQKAGQEEVGKVRKIGVAQVFIPGPLLCIYIRPVVYEGAYPATVISSAAEIRQRT